MNHFCSNFSFNEQIKLLTEMCKISKTKYLICYCNQSFNSSDTPEYYNKKVFNINPFSSIEIGNISVIVDTEKLLSFVKDSIDVNYYIDGFFLSPSSSNIMIVGSDGRKLMLDKLCHYMPSPSVLFEGKMPFFECDFKETDVYTKYYEMRADDGIYMPSLGEKIISLYSGLLNDTKADKIAVRFYSYDEVSFIAVFDTYKKNKFTVSSIFRYMVL